METRLRFNYRALDASGAERKGLIEGIDERSAIQGLIAQGLVPLETTPESEPARTAGLKAGRASITAADRQFFFTELGTLLGSGISLAEALASMARAYARFPLGRAMAAISADVNAGRPLSDAIARSVPGVPRYAVAMVRAGEASGQIAQSFRGISEQLDYDRKVARDFRDALTYPIILVSAGLVALTVVFIGVVPRFASLLTSKSADMPALSRWVIELGVSAEQHKTVIALAALALVAVLAALLRNPDGRQRLRELAVSLPLVGPWLVRMAVARWLTVLATLLKSRIPFVLALSLSSEALDVIELRRSVEAMESEIKRGLSLSACLATRGWFPETRTNMIWVGERSGQLPAMLATLGGLETEGARETRKRLLALIEPIAILTIGAAIGFVMVAIMMAITSMNSMVN